MAEIISNAIEKATRNRERRACSRRQKGDYYELSVETPSALSPLSSRQMRPAKTTPGTGTSPARTGV